MYDKMRKMLPEGPVRQKMSVDGFSEEEIDAYFAGKPIPKKAAPAGGGALAGIKGFDKSALVSCLLVISVK